MKSAEAKLFFLMEYLFVAEPIRWYKDTIII